MAKKGHLFTPRTKSGERLKLMISKQDHGKLGRGRWKATVTDIKTKTQYVVCGASCGLPRCMCDARVVSIIPPTETA